MRPLLTIGFLMLCLAAMLRPAAPLLEYALNRDYIEQVLCINKDEPEMQCHGKCYLEQQLQKAAEEQQPEKALINLQEYPLALVSQFPQPLVRSSSGCLFELDDTGRLPSGFMQVLHQPPKC